MHLTAGHSLECSILYLTRVFVASLCVLLQRRFKGAKGSALHEDIYVLHENGTLEIPVAQKDSTGTYTCVARNKLGMAKNEVHLEVKGETEILKNFFQVLHDIQQISPTLSMDNSNFNFQIPQESLSSLNMQLCKEGAPCPLSAK